MIYLERLDFSYEKSKPLIKKLTLTLEKGKIYGLLGKNGMGKTTLFKHMAGFLSPMRGYIKYQQEHVSSRKYYILENLFFRYSE